MYSAVDYTYKYPKLKPTQGRIPRRITYLRKQDFTECFAFCGSRDKSENGEFVKTGLLEMAKKLSHTNKLSKIKLLEVFSFSYEKCCK